MAKPLFIIGAGGFAKEVYFLLKEVDPQASVYSFQGFVNPETAAPVKVAGKDLPVISELDFFSRATLGTSVVLGIGNPAVSAKVMKPYLEHSGLAFPNLIHPNFVGYRADTTMGQGNVITAGCIFTLGIGVGSFNIFNLATTIGHDAQIGSFNIFNPGCNISGGVVVGDRNLFGTNATMLQNLKVGNDSVIGAGSVITKDVQSRYVYVGSPAKPIREIPSHD